MTREQIVAAVREHCGEVDVSVGPTSTIVLSRPGTYALVAFTDRTGLASRLGVEKSAVVWRLRTQHVLTSKGVRPDYDGMLVIAITPTPLPDWIEARP